MNTDDPLELPPLSEEKDVITRSVEGRADAPPARPRDTGPLDYGLGAPWVADLRIDNVTLSYRLEAEQRLLFGRTDGNVQPEIDLTPYGGLNRGVSRRHAVLVATGDRLEIIDLKSTNGTFINGQRLQPFKPYRLRHTDEITLGDVRIDLMLDVMPIHLSPRWHQPWVSLRTVTSPRGHGKRILLVENNPQTSNTIRAVLTGFDYSVQAVDNLSDAFHVLTQRLPDAMVLNLDLNVVNGLDICFYIQRIAADVHIPLIIISQRTDDAHVTEIMNAGADVFLGKPVGIDELVRVVATVTQDTSIPSAGE
jgi:CheY-like chemotaxis protein